MAKLDLIINAKDKASGPLGKITKKAGGLGKVLGGGLKLGALGAAAGIAGLGVVGFKAVQAAQEQDRVEKQLAATLKSTGGAAGLTADEVKKMAAEFQKTTTYGDEATIAGQNILLTFTNIGKKVFPAATETMLNMSTALGQDMKSSAIQLGKALNDPVKGVTALSKVGVSFTEAQKEQIKVMAEAGDAAGAQTLILKELEKEFGGSAAAAANTFGGRLTQLQNVFGDLLEMIGFAIIPVLTKVAMVLTSFLVDHQKDIEAFAKLISKGLGAAFAWLGKQIPPVVAIFKSDVLPVLKKIGKAIVKDVLPVVIDFGRAWIKLYKDIAVFLFPALDTLADLWSSVLQPALEAILPILKKVGQFLLDHKPILIGVAVAILLLTNPWLAVAAAIAVVLAKWDEISAFFTGLGKDIKKFVDDVITKVEEFPIIGEIFKDVIRTAKVYIEAQLKLVILIFKTALKTIKNAFDFWKAIFSGDWDAAWNAVKAQFKVIVDLLAGIFGIALDLVKGMLTSKLEMVKGIGKDLGNLIVDAAKAIWNSLKTKFSEAVNGVATWLGGAVGAVKAIGVSLGNLVLAGAAGVWGGLTTAFSTAVNAIATWLEGAASAIKGIGASVGRLIMEGLNDGIRAAEGYVKGALNFLITLVERGINAVIALINAIPSVTLPFGGGTIGVPHINPVRIDRLEQGAWDIPHNELAYLHKHEMVLPADVAGAVRAGGAGGVTVKVNIERVGVGVTERELRELASLTQRVFEQQFAD